ncbi:hypothetical protein ASD35_02655 [Pelomonas sp. Root1444]|nr:hypothetical protein ASD35_02655 [Pelomonas sp. Root1444]
MAICLEDAPQGTVQQVRQPIRVVSMQLYSNRRNIDGAIYIVIGQISRISAYKGHGVHAALLLDLPLMTCDS